MFIASSYYTTNICFEVSFVGMCYCETFGFYAFLFFVHKQIGSKHEE
jgi:hypothetical protein